MDPAHTQHTQLESDCMAHNVDHNGEQLIHKWTLHTHNTHTQMESDCMENNADLLEAKSDWG